MADEFQTSGNWWDSTRANRFEAVAGSATSPSSSATLNSLANFGWSSGETNTTSSTSNNNNNNLVDHMKSRVSMDSSASPMVLGSDNSSGAGDANLHMMGLGLSNNSQSLDWNQGLFRGVEKSAPEGSFRAILQDSNYNTNNNSQDHQFQWRSSSSISSDKLFHGHHDHHSTTSSPPNHHHHTHQHQLQHQHHITNRGFSLDQQSHQFSPQYSSGDSTVTPSFNVDSSALYGSPSAIIQGLFGPDVTSTQQQQQSSNPTQNLPYNFTNEILGSTPWASSCVTTTTTSNSNTNSTSTTTNNNANKLPQFLRSNNSPPKQQPYSSTNNSNNHLQFSNAAPFWNAPEAALKDIRPGFFPPLQPQFPASTFDQKPNKNISEVRDSGSVTKKSGNEVASNKRSRNDQTPSTLPAFKVRKEKMGDRITALQQLVSPFGKTDTASVLSEAIEYIKFLHEQVNVLSTPYMKSGVAIQQHHQNNLEKSKDPEDLKQDLRSRGLCLVPVSSTFPVTHETTVDFWNPTFGGTFR